MKRIAILLAVFMVIGAAPGWCVISTVDNYVVEHTKSSSFRPIEDAGLLYENVDKSIDTSLDKIKLRPILFDPIDKVVKVSIDGTRTIVNGVWDIVTFKSMRTKK
jgi:hypothetical protein